MRKHPKKPNLIDPNEFYSLKDKKSRIKFLLRYAVLAPSTHNTQPWKIKIEDSACQILADFSRQLPAADAKKRDLYISIGALMKNLEIAARAFGVYEKTAWSGKANLAATVHFRRLDKPEKTVTTGGLLKAIQTRSNYRGPFAKVELGGALKSQIRGSSSKDIKVDLITDKQKIDSLGRLTAEALKFAYSKPDFRREISSWIRPNTSRKRTGIPGYSLRMGTLTSHIIPKLIKRINIGKKLAALNYKSFVSSSGVVIFSSKKENPLIWLKIGSLAQEIFLSLEKKGVSASIFVAAIEMGEFNKTVANILNAPSELRPQFLFCIGKPILPKLYSPRESVQSKLIS